MMVLPIRPLGDYWQLLQKHGLLSSDKPLPAELLSRLVHLVSCDSQAVEPGTLFIVKGAHFRGRYLADALEKGAFVYLSDHVWEEAGAAPCLLVRDVRRAMALLADFYYDHPSGKLSVVGITGTKGKSSTTYYLKYIFDEYLSARKKRPSGVISSIDTFDGVEQFESHLTTPEPLDLERHFANAVSSGLEYLTMEVSSQALKYDRMDGVDLSAAVFLNIGYDHISPIEHPDFEDYFASKLRIFAQAAAACVNLDCDHADRVLEAARKSCPRIITFSQTDPSATIFGSQVRKAGGDILFRVKTPRYSREFRLTMPGLFNVQNALAALAVCEAVGVPEQYAFAGLMKARVPGRMEVYANADEKVSVIVDYAHNRLSFETLFRSVREEYPGRRIVTVFGCPGYKAYDRRKDLGEISGQYSDLVILTEEDPGEEPVENICRDIAQYVAQGTSDYSIVPDRGEAIKQAVMSCDEPTVILLTGKGAETRQKRGTEYIDTPSDVEYVQAFLQEYDLRRGLDQGHSLASLTTALPALAEQRDRTLVVSCPGPLPPTLPRDLEALCRAGARVVLVCPADGAQADGLGTRAVGLGTRDGGLFQAEGGSVSPRPQLLHTLLSGGFLPVVAVPGQWALTCDEAAAALARAMAAHRLVLFTREEPSLAAGENRQAALLHMDSRRAASAEGGMLPPELSHRLSLCAQAVQNGVGECALLGAGEEHMLLLYLLRQRILGITVTQ